MYTGFSNTISSNVAANNDKRRVEMNMQTQLSNMRYKDLK